MNIAPSRFICEKCRRIFSRRRERGSGRNSGNRVPRNYRRRDRFRDSLPECTRWNADSSRDTTPIYGTRLRNRACQKILLLLEVTFITQTKVARRWLEINITILRRCIAKFIRLPLHLLWTRHYWQTLGRYRSVFMATQRSELHWQCFRIITNYNLTNIFTTDTMKVIPVICVKVWIKQTISF